MEKTFRLIIARHGKAEDGFGKTDFLRNLNDKGREKTKKAARQLISNHRISPHKILASSANRCYQTAEIYAGEFNMSPEKIEFTEELYLASVRRILKHIEVQGSEIDEFMIVGHNPDISALAEVLCPRFQADLPTSGVVGVELKMSSWADIHHTQGELLFFI